MRRLVAVIIIMLCTVGCQSPAPSSAHNLAPLMREQTAEMKALREQIALLQDQVTALKHRPVTSEVPVPAGQRKYAIAVGKAQGLRDRDAIYILHVESGRIIAFVLTLGTSKFEIDGAHEIDPTRILQGRARALRLPSPAFGIGSNAGFLTARILDDEEALIVIDERNHQLHGYRLDRARKRLALIASEDLAKVFELTPGDDADPKAKE